MEITTERTSWGTIIRFKGRVTWRDTGELGTLLSSIAQEKPAKTLLDLSQTPYIDSSIISSLVEFRKSVDPAVATIYIVASPVVIRSLLDANLDRVFRIVEDESVVFQQRQDDAGSRFSER